MPYFNKGERVRIAAHSNLFAMGERFAEIISTGRKWIHATGERSGRRFRFPREGDELEFTTPRVTISAHGADLFCIRESSYGGFTCLGFDVLEERVRGYLDWLALEVTDEETATAAAALRASPAARGTLERFTQYESALALAGAYARRTGRKCTAELNPRLIGLEGKRVEVRTPDGETRRFTVGRSSGWSPIHLEIASARSHGGGWAYVPEGATVRVVS